MRDTLAVQYPATTAPPPPPLPGTRPAGPTAADATRLRYAVDPDDAPRSAHWPLGCGARTSLTLDTTRRLAAEERFNADLRTDPASQWFAAYPVVLRNRDRDTVRVGEGGYVPLPVEAQDALGRWRDRSALLLLLRRGAPLTLPAPGAGRGHRRVDSPWPLSNAFTAALRAHGLPPFSGRIPPGQFTSQFDAHGEYQAAYLKERQNRAHRPAPACSRFAERKRAFFRRRAFTAAPFRYLYSRHGELVPVAAARWLLGHFGYFLQGQHFIRSA